MSVLIYGSTTLDRIKTPLAEHRNLLGGSASYASCAASFYGPVRIVSRVGTDFPQRHFDFLQQRGIDLTGLERVEGKTFAWAAEYGLDPNERRTLSVELNVLEHFSPVLPPAFRDSPFVLIATDPPRNQAKVRAQLTAPKFIALDTIDIWIETARNDLLPLLSQIDLLLLNESEAQLLSGEKNLVHAAHRLLKMGPRFVLIKKGEQGAVLFAPDRCADLPAFPLKKITDPTGAGDCFAGALIGSCAVEGDVSFEGLRAAMVEATLLASFSIEALSLGRLQTLTTEEIAARRAEFKKIIG